MSAGKPTTGIAASLGLLQHARKGPQAVQAASPNTQQPDTQIPVGLGTQVFASPLPLQGSAKRSHPDFVQLKAYVRKGTKRDAMRKAEDEGVEDFSALIQELLEGYLRT